MASTTQKRERPEATEPEAEEEVEIVSPDQPQEAQRENIPTEEVMCPGCGANLVTVQRQHHWDARSETESPLKAEGIAEEAWLQVP